MDTVHQTRVIELLIEHADAIFGPESSSILSAAALSRDNPAHRNESTSSSLLSKVPVVRSISFLERHRSRSREAAEPPGHSSLRHVAHEEIILPGFVPADSTRTPNSSLDLTDPLSLDEGLMLGLGLGGSADNDDLPDFLLPDDSVGSGSKAPRKLPGYLRTSTAAPKIFKSSLKDYHGLEGVDLNLLSSQDSETHSLTPSRSGKRSVTEQTATAGTGSTPSGSNSGVLHEAENSHHSLSVHTTTTVVKLVKMDVIRDGY